jgi:hypothetical protein
LICFDDKLIGYEDIPEYVFPFVYELSFGCCISCNIATLSYCAGIIGYLLCLILYADASETNALISIVI